MKLKKYLFIGMLFMMTSSMALAATSPVSLLQSLSSQMISQLKSKRLVYKSNPSAVHSLVRRVLMPHVDMNVLSHAVLGREWKRANSAQRKEFISRFTNILIGTYGSALAAYTNETVQFLPLKSKYSGKDIVRVDSKIIRSGAPAISVSYRLFKRGSNWKVFDLIVEGVSLVQNYRAQFGSIINNGGMNALLSRMASHNAKR